MHKNCPFCKKQIKSDDIKCPHCGMTLIEKITSSKSYSSNTQQSYSYKETTHKNIFKKTIKDIRSYFNNPKIYKVKNAYYKNKDKYKKILIVIAIVIFIFGLYSHRIRPVTTPNQVAPVVAPTVNILPIVLPQDFNSLNNGTVWGKKSYYFNGYGELEISNGTNHDAVAKLVSVITDKSVFNVYVKAKSTYTITGINDGNYKLVFNLGKNWDEINKKFLVGNSYEMFEEPFNYSTTISQEGDYEYTNYGTFKVTLNPVLNGDAKTSPVNPDTFNNY